MDNSDPDIEELPYVVWYQCRMCTHLFFDDVEKMFMHFDKRHGAMIDCDELRSIVFKNGLSMGGLSRSPQLAEQNEEDNDIETALISPHEQFGYFDCHEDEDEETAQKVLVQNTKFEPGSGCYNEDEPVKDKKMVLPEIIRKKIGKASSVNNKSSKTKIIQNGRSGPPSFHQRIKMNVEELVVDSMESNVYDEDVDPSELCEPSHLQIDQEYEEVQGLEHNCNQDDFQDDDEITVRVESVSEINYMDGEIYEEEDEYDAMHHRNAHQSRQGQQNKDDLSYGYACKFCDKFFSTRRGVETHEQNHKTQSVPPIKRSSDSRRFPCRLCKDKFFTSFKDLKSHIKSHTPARIHICKFCFATFNNTASLTKHLSMHTRENPHKCHCGKTFVSANTLKIHKKIHTGVKPFVCNFLRCGRAFVTKSTLESHFRTHTGDKPFQCGYCPSSFTTSSAKYRHERHVHKVPDPSLA